MKKNLNQLTTARAAIGSKTGRATLRNLCITFVAMTAMAASAQHFTSESSWQTAAGTYSLETFDGIAAGTQVTSLPGLGIQFDFLNNGVNHPSVENHTTGFGGFAHSEPNVLFNAVNPVLPGLGPIILRPISASQVIVGVGYWNTGGDDSSVLTFYDANNNLLDTLDTGTANLVFNGIINLAGASKVVISPGSIGNAFFSVDDLQVKLVQIPEPGILALLLGTGIPAALVLRRRRR